MIENSLNLVKVARELGILVIHVTEGYTDDYREVDLGNGGEFHRNAVLWQAFKSSSWGAGLYEPIRGEKDIVLPDRKTMSGFGGNALDYILKSRGIRNVAVGGFTADVCVYATLLAGYDLGYRMYAITDAVVAGSAALTKEMEGFLYPYVSRPMTSGEFLAMFRRAKDGWKASEPRRICGLSSSRPTSESLGNALCTFCRVAHGARALSRQ